MSLADVKTVIILLLENRSFDHMLGYLHLPPSNRAEVDGQRTEPSWLARFTNLDHGQPYQPRRSTNPYTLPPGFDPPHERSNVADQLGPLKGGAYPMTGF